MGSPAAGRCASRVGIGAALAEGVIGRRREFLRRRSRQQQESSDELASSEAVGGALYPMAEHVQALGESPISRRTDVVEGTRLAIQERQIVD